MGRRSTSWARVVALALACAGGTLTLPSAAQAQVPVGHAAESPSDALARNVRLLAASPRDFNALIGAGKAALALGDGQAAAGFFGRAEEVWPASPLPQAGMAAALAHEGEAAAALQYFGRAVQLGATASMIGVERGLAYDLLGQHAQAQADYRAALATPADADEARRRLALSLAITGNKAQALSTLGPLMARGDSAAARCRAFVLALTGDAVGAKAALDARMPGSSASMAYFFQRLPTLRSDQKAAAVHLGIFPDTAAQMASAQPPATPGTGDGGDRLASIDELLRRSPPSPLASGSVRQSARTVASAPVRPRASQEPDVQPRSRIWIQLASGSNAGALPEEFRRIKRRGDEVLEGISGYVAQDSGRVRLVIGPFRNSREAGIFLDDLSAKKIDAFAWTNAPGQVITKLRTE